MKITFHTFISILMLSLFMVNGLKSQNQAPNFTLTDQFGEEHNLYEDYLDKGKTVLLNMGAAWSPVDSQWISLGILQDFHVNFAGPDAAVIWIEADSTTNWDDLYGTGNNGVGYDFVTGNDYPILNPSTNQIIDDFRVIYYPSMYLVCPDGTMYAESDSSSNANDIFYGNFQDAEIIAEAMYSYCGTTFDLNEVTVDIYEDDNNDCIVQANEQGVSDVKLLITDQAGNERTRISKDDGSIRFLAREDVYELELVPPNVLWEACNNPQDLTVVGNNGTYEAEFGLQKIQDCPYPQIQISCPFLRRCFDSHVYIKYCNEGTEVLEDAIVEVELNDFLLDPSSNLDFNQVGNFLIFEVGDIGVLECATFWVSFKVDCDIDLGTELCYSVSLLPNPCDLDSLNYAKQCQEVVGSWDPNDKRAFPLSGSDDYIIKPNEKIDYQIRFQNTGTDTAFNIVVEDVISDQLNLRSFKPGVSSHDYRVEIDENRKVHFYFDNVMLPDSFVNEPASNGFVNYSIEQKPDLENGVEITNLADIFFDFNEPVRTNTTTHKVDDGISNTTEQEFIEFSISPNPTRAAFNFELSDLEDTNGILELIDLTGKKLKSFRITDQQTLIQTSDLSQGAYLIKYIKENGNYYSQILTVQR